MTDLFSPLELRGVTLRNRIALSPMCQYSGTDGLANDWHLVHLGARAIGGAGLLISEATAVEARGRITPNCLGIWADEHVAPLRRVCEFVAARGSVPGIQLAHAGVKASRHRPWHPTPNAYVPPRDGGWMPVGPSARRFNDDGPVPHELSIAEVRDVREAFAAAAGRAVAAGFRVIELHFAHGYLGHSFLSPLMNHRRDGYGGPFDHRVSLLLETVKAVRETIPQETPLFVRLSCTDWVDGGWTLDDSVETARLLKRAGVDLVDCSSGGASRRADIPVGPGYQVPLAQRIRSEARIATGAVGLITAPAQADEVIREGRADLVLLGRQLLREPHWPLRAWVELKAGGQAPVAREYAWALAETKRS
jgi:2,4-dienoyl-CoA reductase-like NADH-dependent reductase (Old Yellow Enzyme family)